MPGHRVWTYSSSGNFDDTTKVIIKYITLWVGQSHELRGRVNGNNDFQITSCIEEGSALLCIFVDFQQLSDMKLMLGSAVSQQPQWGALFCV